MSQFSRNKLVSLAELCFENSLYNGVISYWKKISQLESQLNFNERQLLFASYYELRRPLFKAFTLCGDTNIEGNIQNELQIQAKKAILKLCDEAIKQIKTYFVTSDIGYKATADYKCFLAVQHSDKAYFASGREREFEVSRALYFYEEATIIANKHLNPAHPIRLAVAVSNSLLYRHLLD